MALGFVVSGWKNKYKDIWWHIASLYFERVSGIWGYVLSAAPMHTCMAAYVYV